ncbi:hypothetical protein [Oceanococcus atlanticus]|uniref:hypothetical protein n=1 Tax=Oceanococcus atlanticus TaxID=1317117 RepID=UPI0011BAA52E|nr:hypothetical protein [Oceanococcus atlanticus]
MAELVLDPESHFPEELGIYFWLYPYWDQVSVRGCGYMVRWGTPPLVISILKFTPLAFMVTWNAHPGFTIPHTNLCDFIVGNGAAPVDLPLGFSNIPPQRYPEAPGDEGIVLHTPLAYIAERSK